MKALNDLLEDGAFEASPRNRRFLRFVVEETLAGRGDRIKSYTIAVDVFGRTSDFDGSVDPIVRIEASRLRASLTKYYANSNHDHAIQFLLPRGGYVPEFKLIEDAPAATNGAGEHAVAAEDGTPEEMDGDDRAERPVRASRSQARVEARPALRLPREMRRLEWVLPAGLTTAVVLLIALAASFSFRPPQVVEPPLLLVDQVEPLTKDEPTRVLARTLSESLISALQQFDGLVISPKPDGSNREIAELLERNPNRSVYLLASELLIDHDTVRLWWRLSDQRTMAVDWTSTQEGPWNPNSSSTEEEIAKQVATAIAYRNGLVKSFEARTLPDPPPPGYLCVLWAQRYPLSMDAKTHAVTRDCLEKTVALSPNNADAWAYLATIYADEARNGYNLDTAREQALAKAKHATATAVRLAPFAASGYVAAMVVDFQEGDFEGFDEAYRRAMQIGPSDPRTLVIAGNRLWAMGRFEAGIALIKKALAINKNPGPFDGLFLAVEEYRQQHYRQALAILGTMPESFFVIPATKAACYGELGDQEHAQPELAQLLKLRPNYAREMRREARGSHYVPSFVDAFADGLKKAGLEIADDEAPIGAMPQPNKLR